MFHPKGKLGPDNVVPLIGMVEVEGIPLPLMKPSIIPPLEEDPYVGIIINDMGIVTLVRLIGGKKDMTDVPWIKGPLDKGIDGVGPMVLKEGNVNINEMPPVPLMDRIFGSSTMDETLGSNMV
jgi:hypothetical protein